MKIFTHGLCIAVILLVSINNAQSQNCQATVTNFPYNESFETGLGLWTQSNDDDRDWSRRSGNTPSNNTGPTDANDGNWYLYTEASNNSYRDFDLDSPCFDLTSTGAPEFSFYYHMYGANMGTLSVDVSIDNGLSFDAICSRAGQDQNNSNTPWKKITIDLSSYKGHVINIRLHGRSGSNYRSDIAVDQLSLIDLNPTPQSEINITGNGLNINNGDNSPSLNNNTNFGTVNTNTQISKNFVIENSGDASLNVSEITSSNSEFSIIGITFPVTIAVGGSFPFTIQFNSPSVGTKNSLITVKNNDINKSNFTFNLEAVAEQNFFDSDGDGIYDNVDIDDDNDGLRDDLEENNCQNSNISITTNYKFLNETFGSGTTRTTINTTYDAATTYCYEDGSIGTNTIDCPNQDSRDLNDGKYTVYYTTGNGDGINQTPNEDVASWADDIWYTGPDHTAGDTNGRMALFNASYDPGLFYSASIKGALPNVPITYGFWVLNLDKSDINDINTRLRPNILVEFRDLDGNLLTSITTGDIPPTSASNPTGDWYNFTANVSFSVDEFNVFFINNEVGGLGNDLAIDDIEIKQSLCDLDADGVADIFDLDSDNDGIPDVVENGLGNFSQGRATLTGTPFWLDANKNGMHDAFEGLIAVDSDGDGTPNYLDLDSDNDGIFDVDESGAGNSGDVSYQNGDGDINGDGVGDGPDTDQIRARDIDSDGAIEYFTDGILDIYDFYNGNTMSTGYGNINQGLGNYYYVKDTDNDGTPDYIDTTSDGSTFDISKTLYASLDINNNGKINGNQDADGDGLLDAFDTNDAAFGSPRDLNRKLQLYFDGRNDYGDDQTLALNTDDFTVMGWIKIDDDAFGSMTLFGQKQWDVTIKPNKTLKLSAGALTLDGTITLPTSQWIHVAATINKLDEEIKLYINGALDSEITGSVSITQDTSYFTLAKSSQSATNYFKGYMDEVRIFSKTLSADELRKMIYQEIEDNSGIVRGLIIPRDVTNFIDEDHISALPWSSLLRYFRMDVYKDNIIDNFSTALIDDVSGARIYNNKIIGNQTAPLPFKTQRNGLLPEAIDNPIDGVNGLDAITYDWSIVEVADELIDYNHRQKHLGLIISEKDASNKKIKFTVNEDSELNVSWYLKLDGHIDLEGESQLVQGPDSYLDPTSLGSLDRDQQGTADVHTYNYWSSPVGDLNNSTNNNAYRIKDVMYDGEFRINFSSAGYNGAATHPIRIADYWLWKFANRQGGDYSEWQHVRKNGTMLVGEGFTMKGPGTGSISDEQNYVFKGKPNNGLIELPIHTGNDYLVGNPYPSAIDAIEFIKSNGPTLEFTGSQTETAPNISGTLYFWEHWGGGSHLLKDYQGGYATFNFSGSVAAAAFGTNDPDVATGGTPSKLPQKYIPVGQGFFVTGAADGQLVFKNSQRIFETEASGNSEFLRSEKNNKSKTVKIDVDQRFKLRLGFNSVNTMHRQLLLTIDENASKAYDWGYDGLTIDDQMDDLSWWIDGKPYVIQGSNDISNQVTYPLILKVSKSGMNELTIDALENTPENLLIYVYDANMDLYHDLNTSNYNFYSEEGEFAERFHITFSQPSTLSAADEILKSLQLYYLQDKNTIKLINPAGIQLKRLELFNMLGQSITTFENLSESDNSEYQVKHLNTGTYIIKLDTVSGSLSKKIIIK